jgi:uncharacterized protein (TIGR03437 family)
MGLLCSSAPAFQASGVTQFSDRATWENASANLTSVSFAGLGGVSGGAQYPDMGYPSGISINGAAFKGGLYEGYSYLFIRTASTSNFMYGAADSDLGCPPPQIPCGTPGAGITISLPLGATSVGLDIGSFWPPNSVTIQLPSGQTFTIPSVPLLQNFATANTFVGFVSPVPISSLTVQAAGLPIIRDMSFGGTSTSITPFISPNGIVPLYSVTATIQPGEWVSLYGNKLASSTTVWNGDFPISLGGTSVTVDGKAVYLWFVSPGQINFQAPNDLTIGVVPVVVTTAAGSVTSQVTLSTFAPSFSLLDSSHVAGIILRSNGSGAYGGGTYDIIGPTESSLGYVTVPAKPGDSLELFGVGFGPTTPIVPAGQPYSGAAPTTNSVQLAINGVTVIPSFAGLSSGGLYQLNFTMPPAIGTGDVLLVAAVGGVQTQSGVVISLQ